MISLYLICWSYTLYTGTYMLTEKFLDLIKQLQDTTEPFSGDMINNDPLIQEIIQKYEAK